MTTGSVTTTGAPVCYGSLVVIRRDGTSLDRPLLELLARIAAAG